MSIDCDTWARIRLEKQGYRSRKHLSRYASSWFLSPDVLAINKARKLLVIRENSDQKSSLYFKLTPKGLSELKKLGKSFRYHTRGEKITEKDKKIRCDGLISRFEKYSFDDLTIERYELECKGWIPARTFRSRPPDFLIQTGLVEQKKFHKIEKNMTYYRLTKKGKAILQARRIKAEFINFKNKIKELETEHRSLLKTASANITDDVTNWTLLCREEDSGDYWNKSYVKLSENLINHLIQFRNNFKLPKHV
jgi:DNA-binding PadR family transcriptional regulator